MTVAVVSAAAAALPDKLRRQALVQCVNPGEVLVLRQPDLPVRPGEVREIAQLSEIVLHVSRAAVEFNSVPHVIQIDVVPGGLAVFLVQIHGAARRLVRVLNDAQAVFQADTVGYVPQALYLGFGIVVFLPVPETDGIEQVIIVQMILIQMRGDENLKPVAPQLSRQGHADIVALLRRDLSGLEALVAVERDIPVCFPVLPLGQDHLLQRRLLQAVDGGDIVAVRRGRRALNVAGCIPEVLQFRVGLLRVLHIVHQIPEGALDMPQARGRHQEAAFRGSVSAACKSRIACSSRCAASVNSGLRMRRSIS